MSMRERNKLINLELEEGLDVLQKGITKILEGLPEPQFSSNDYMMLYTTVYNICIQSQRPPYNDARQLYDKYKATFDVYITSTVLPSLREKKDEILVRELLIRWSNHKIMTKCLLKFFRFLDKFNIPRWGVPSLEETSFLSFYYLVYEEMNKQVLDAILVMIDRKCAGEKIDQTLGINALDFYLEFEEITRKNNAKEVKMHGSSSISSKKIKLISSDGDVFEVDFGVALMSKTFEDIVETIPVGDVDSISVSFASSKILKKIIEYCKKHNSAQKDVDLRDWDVQFVDVDLETLFELQTSASSLKIDSLKELVTIKYLLDERQDTRGNGSGLPKMKTRRTGSA